MKNLSIAATDLAAERTLNRIRSGATCPPIIGILPQAARSRASRVQAFSSPILGVSFLIVLLLSPPGNLLGATLSKKLPVVPKWERYEHAFESLIAYANPLQDVTLKVLFTSPLGETSEIYGFWDGGRVWRVRFSPDQPGRWTFRTTCSDAANMGLNEQSGEFLCTSALGQSRFDHHGPVRVASDGQHLEHADRTPFFWLADTVWGGARLSEPKNWEIYGVIRSSQNFSVAQWSVSPGEDFKGQSALTGFPEKIGVNPEFFRALDAKVATLAEVGILSAIAPLWEPQPQAAAVALPDSQASLLLRYVVARFGADPVAWVIPAGDNQKSAERWERIGREVFGGTHHAPVLVCAGKDRRALARFATLEWVDMIGAPVPTNGSGEVLSDSQSAGAGSKAARHLIIAITPEENGVGAQKGTRVTAEAVRQSSYRSLLAGHAAGITYSGHGVVDWNATVDPKTVDKLGAGLPFWHKALFMPAAKQMGYLAKLASSVRFCELQPAPKLIAGPTDVNSTPARAFAASTETKDLLCVYVEQHRMLELSMDEMPQALGSVTWFNPRRGDTSPTVAVVVQRTCQFPTPDQSDWLLVMKAGK